MDIRAAFNELSLLPSPREPARRASENLSAGTAAETALGQIEARDIEPFLCSSLILSSINPDNVLKVGALGCPGAGVGLIAKSIDEARAFVARGEAFILAVPETSQAHVEWIKRSAGVITARGGSTSHAAIITRGEGIPAIIGADNLDLQSGALISIDGAKGLVALGAAKIEPATPDDLALARILEAADDVGRDQSGRMIIKGNADTGAQARLARKFGAQGIGVARTEHMFDASDRLPLMRRMILADNETERRAALETLFPMQKQDFKDLLYAMDGLPVTIRLLDPPLHEFLPGQTDEESIAALGKEIGYDPAVIKERIEALHESNSMMGMRGVRLLLTYPEILEMQVRAIAEAAAELREEGHDPMPCVMVPLITFPEEMDQAREKIRDVKGADFEIGTMLEVPSACLKMEELARFVEFASFGTNDLTQYTTAFSRDDTVKLLDGYHEKKIVSQDPFVTVDRGVAKLMAFAIREGKKANPVMTFSVCGEHAGDPASIEIFQEIGVDTLSVSPFRIPVARVAAAKTWLGARDKEPAFPKSYAL